MNSYWRYSDNQSLAARICVVNENVHLHSRIAMKTNRWHLPVWQACGVERTYPKQNANISSPASVASRSADCQEKPGRCLTAPVYTDPNHRLGAGRLEISPRFSWARSPQVVKCYWIASPVPHKHRRTKESFPSDSMETRI
ncbi:uncharacterized protein HMPREF1120_07462 [Exophiala dermatitidis NIH/UT8656]|uniref:Uncharacterized protein n=1 Tax=Exophiala dermatitidis (strain ATCC 34100 / CBS 525.76 / NIH/UT8656) TaxID=858893 RepID=H6C6X8_EXODN|nr:uncharacterized protein HMPREF1120_07462 [Exophiala dermatitidis NIH/UT8656]EHY59474.1 hypothetical protein HMPREF1120_07462 [Exophiala dermatitidis NIH/UT8656]